MVSFSTPQWAKLISLNPFNEDIYLLTSSDEQNQCEFPNEWRISQKLPQNTCWIQNLSSSFKIKIENEIFLATNEEKEIFNGERISFILEKADAPQINSDYVFCLVNFQPNNDLKRPREESQKSSINEASKKLLKIENVLHQELTCSICKKLLNESATLSPCQHIFCGPCLFKKMRTSFKCPLCRVEVVSVKKNETLQNLLQFTSNNFPSLNKLKEEAPSKKQPELFGDIIRDELGTYFGGWVKSKREGFGRMVYKNGAVYEGFWRKNQREGKGTLTSIDGSEYEGNWKNDQRNGFGSMIYQSGEIYAGQWKKGKKEGQGHFRTQGGNIYGGEWMDDCFHGDGVMTYANGNVFQGKWQRNNRHGKGIIILKSGDKFDGEWKDGEHYGQGKWTSKNQKRTYERLWKPAVKNMYKIREFLLSVCHVKASL